MSVSHCVDNDHFYVFLPCDNREKYLFIGIFRKVEGSYPQCEAALFV